VAYCADTGVLGVPFMVVSHVDGWVPRDGDEAAALPPGDARRCAEALVDTLAALHELDPVRAGLDGFGRPDGYLRRQVRRWHGQWGRVATRNLPDLDNLLTGDDDRIKAVVDWEMATLGDPLADLGLLLVYWNPICEPVLGLRHVPTSNPGFPSGPQLADHYARRSGRDIARLAFYEALGYLKLAVIAEGIHARYLAGQTVGAGFETVGSAVPALLRAGLGRLPCE
jgi:aminoglycoside phosphotransferase (APT) family kinase protein